MTARWLLVGPLHNPQPSTAPEEKGSGLKAKFHESKVAGFPLPARLCSGPRP